MKKGQGKKIYEKYFILLICGVLLFIWAGAAQGADNAACLKCHQNPRLSKGKKDGALLSLYVNPPSFQASVHGAGGLGCTDCHQEARPDVHPAEGFAKVDCANCHSEAAESYKKTTHGMMWASGLEDAPQCADCHSAHYIRKIKDPESPVNAQNLPQACAKCHEEAKPVAGFLTTLASYRLKGHPKTGLNYRYDTQICANCHPENAGHPQKEGRKSICVKCHDKSYSTPALLGPIHFKVSWSSQPFFYIMRFIYGFGIVLIVIAAAGSYAYRLYGRRKKELEKTLE